MEIFSYIELKKKAHREIDRLKDAESKLDELTAIDAALNAAFTIYHLIEWREHEKQTDLNKKNSTDFIHSEMIRWPTKFIPDINSNTENLNNVNKGFYLYTQEENIYVIVSHENKKPEMQECLNLSVLDNENLLNKIEWPINKNNNSHLKMKRLDRDIINMIMSNCKKTPKNRLPTSNNGLRVLHDVVNRNKHVEIHTNICKKEETKPGFKNEISGMLLNDGRQIFTNNNRPIVVRSIGVFFGSRRVH